MKDNENSLLMISLFCWSKNRLFLINSITKKEITVALGNFEVSKPLNPCSRRPWLDTKSMTTFAKIKTCQTYSILWTIKLSTRESVTLSSSLQKLHSTLMVQIQKLKFSWWRFYNSRNHSSSERMILESKDSMHELIKMEGFDSAMTPWFFWLLLIPMPTICQKDSLTPKRDPGLWCLPLAASWP